MNVKHALFPIGLSLLGLAALAGCGLVAEATPQVVEKPVTVVVERTVEVTVVVEKIITATPRPSPTPTQTPVSTPTIAVEIPDDWVLYEDPTDVFTLYHPANWSIGEQFRAGIIFGIPGDGFIVIAPMSDPPTRGEAGDPEAVNEMVRKIMDENDVVIVLSKGTWDAPVGANYVEYTTQNLANSRLPKRHVVYAEKPIDEQVWWYVELDSAWDETLYEGWASDLEKVMATLCFFG